MTWVQTLCKSEYAVIDNSHYMVQNMYKLLSTGLSLRIMLHIYNQVQGFRAGIIGGGMRII